MADAALSLIIAAKNETGSAFKGLKDSMGGVAKDTVSMRIELIEATKRADRLALTAKATGKELDQLRAQKAANELKALRESASSTGSSLDSFKGKIGALAVGLAGLAAGFISLKTAKDAIGFTAELGAEVSKLSRETGLGAESASRLLFAFKHVGLGADDASRSLGFFSKNMLKIQDASDDGEKASKTTVSALKEIGVNALDAGGNLLPMQDLLTLTADRFAAMPDGIEKTGRAMQLFGKSGKDMIPLLNLGSAGLASLAKEADKLGVTLTTKNLAAIKKYTLAQRDFGEAIGGLKLKLGLALMPALTAFSLWLTGNAHYVSDFADLILNGLTPAFQSVRDVVATFTDMLGAAFQGDLRAAADSFNALPAPLRAVAVGVAIVAKIVNAAWSSLKDLIAIGRDLFDFLGRFRDDAASVLPGMDKLIANLVDLSGNKGAIEAVGKAIAGIVAVMTASVLWDFAGAVAGVAMNIVTFPLDVAKAVAGQLAGIVKSIAGLVSKTVDIAMNVAGTAVDFVQSLAGLAGKAISVTINAIGNALEFLQALVSGAMQRLLDASPLHQKLEIQTATVGADFTKAGGNAGKGWLAGFKAQLNAANIGNVISGIIGGIAGGLITTAAVASWGAAIGGALVAAAPFIAIGAAIAAALAAEAFIAKWVFDAQGWPGVIAFVFGGALGVGIKMALPKIGEGLAALPDILGEAIGRAAVIFITLPFLAVAAIVKGVQLIGPQLKDVGGKIIGGIVDGFTVAIPKIGLAFSVAFDPATYVHIVQALIEQISLTIANPMRILDGIKILGVSLVGGMEGAMQLLADVFTGGMGILGNIANFALAVVDNIFGGFFRGLIEGAKKQWADINELTGGSLNHTVERVGTAVSMMQEAFATGWRVIKWVAVTAWNELKELAGGAWDGIRDAIVTPIQTIIEWIDTLLGKIDDLKNAMPSPGDLLGGITSHVPGFNALGTSNWRGGLTVVGERGPELVNLPRGSRIYSNADSQQMLSGNTTIVNVYPGQIILQGDAQAGFAALGAQYA